MENNSADSNLFRQWISQDETVLEQENIPSNKTYINNWLTENELLKQANLTTQFQNLQHIFPN